MSTITNIQTASGISSISFVDTAIPPAGTNYVATATNRGCTLFPYSSIILLKH